MHLNHPDIKEVLVTAEQIQARIAELAAPIDEFYKDKNVLLLGILKGAVPFMADLARAMQIPTKQDWMAVSSYGSGTVSSGVVRILKDLDTDVKDRNRCTSVIQEALPHFRSGPTAAGCQLGVKNCCAATAVGRGREASSRCLARRCDSLTAYRISIDNRYRGVAVI